MKNPIAPERGVPTPDQGQMALVRSLTVERFGRSAQPNLESDGPPPLPEIAATRAPKRGRRRYRGWVLASGGRR